MNFKILFNDFENDILMPLIHFSGRRFKFCKYDKSHGPIHKYIHKLDKQVSDFLDFLLVVICCNIIIFREAGRLRRSVNILQAL